jgi:hypothetical protein
MDKPPLNLRNEVESYYHEALSYWSDYTNVSRKKWISKMAMITAGLILGWLMYAGDSYSIIPRVICITIILIGMYFYVLCESKARLSYKLYLLRQAWLSNKVDLLLDPSNQGLKLKGSNQFFDIADDANWQ